MIIWIDAQLSPELASWLSETFGIEALPVRSLGMLHAKDREIYQAARQAGAVVMTKDSDFLGLLARLGPPPQVIWVTCAKTSNARLRNVLGSALPTASKLWNKVNKWLKLAMH